MQLHISTIKTITANSLTLFVKLQTLHFMVKGYNFEECHKTTQSLYESFHNIYDWLNERLIQLQSTPISSLKEVMEKTTINETDSKIKKVNEVYKIIEQDLVIMKSLFTKLKKESAEISDYVTEDYAINQIGFIDKELWFINSKLFKDF